jgi:hypothetical protein
MGYNFERGSTLGGEAWRLSQQTIENKALLGILLLESP